MCSSPEWLSFQSYSLSLLFFALYYLVFSPFLALLHATLSCPLFFSGFILFFPCTSFLVLSFLSLSLPAFPLITYRFSSFPLRYSALHLHAPAFPHFNFSLPLHVSRCSPPLSQLIFSLYYLFPPFPYLITRYPLVSSLRLSHFVVLFPCMSLLPDLLSRCLSFHIFFLFSSSIGLYPPMFSLLSFTDFVVVMPLSLSLSSLSHQSVFLIITSILPLFCDTLPPSCFCLTSFNVLTSLSIGPVLSSFLHSPSCYFFPFFPFFWVVTAC